MLRHPARVLAALTLLSLVLACSNVGVYGSVDLMLFRWPGDAPVEKELAAAQPLLTGTSWLAKEIGGHDVLERAQPTITFAPRAA